MNSKKGFSGEISQAARILLDVGYKLAELVM